MKKILYSVLTLGFLSSYANAYNHTGIEFGVGSDNVLNSNIYYKNYNNIDDLVYSANISVSKQESKTYYGKYKYNIYSFGALGGYAIGLPYQELDDALNILAGAYYYSIKPKYDGISSSTLNGFGIQAGVHYSVKIIDNVTAGGEIFLHHDFQDLSSTYIGAGVEGIYDINENLYVNAKVEYQGRSNFSNSKLLVGIGYNF
ncbi:hypothetical protein AVBRAN12642_07075 [Campylobacter sp. RM12642]|uniref:hypothetical protein n=1 Tax=unclassified Campylobacter TaxID=2593542 RepID=UPI001D2DCB2C|nr:hypothetical protein [Campylobacter sp. RM12642]MBZ8008358.1 hypothetical protein [Campylobacter sp. RM9334]